MVNETDKLTVSDKYRAVDELIEESRPNREYYSLLVLSSVIIAAGILLANSSILIGGMLVTPVLNPILLVALGIAASKPNVLKRTGLLILKSSLVIVAISFIAGLIFSVPESGDFYRSSLFDNSFRSAFLYFLVAFASGIAATFAWVRKGITNILPGISIAVALVPPVSMVGIWLATLELDLMRYFLIVFLFNLFGIIMGSMIVFSMLGFYKTGFHIVKRIEEEVIAEAKKEDIEENNPNEESQTDIQEKRNIELDNIND
jgi:uncharacterized hydrophobic protein (TIGR00271 family)